MPTAAKALDKYNAAITAAGPVLHHVGLWNLALSTRTDVNLFLRASRQVETAIGEPLHGPRGRDTAVAATAVEEFSHDWLLGHSRARAEPTREVLLAWLRDAAVWTDWVVDCSELALMELSEQTPSGSRGFTRTVEVEAMKSWDEKASATAASWARLPKLPGRAGSQPKAANP